MLVVESVTISTRSTTNCILVSRDEGAEMDWSKVAAITSTILNLCGIATFTFKTWPQLRKTGTVADRSKAPAIIAGCFVLGLIMSSISIYSAWNRTSIAPVPVAEIPTYVKIQFGSRNTIPIGIDSKNVWRWYAMWRDDSSFALTDPKTSKVIASSGGGSWTLALTFDRPVSYGQIRVDGNGAVLPQYEVKDFTQRTAFIVFNGDLTGMVITIEAI
jgi:hypothetical protein